MFNEIVQKKDQSWIGVDLDRTLAFYDGYKGVGVIGEPIPLMVNRVKDFLKEGKKVKILTARANSRSQYRNEEIAAIKSWCMKVFGQELDVTSEKDHNMCQLYDDLVTKVIANTGVIVS